MTPKPSKTIRNEPTMTKTLQKQYSIALNKLFYEYRRQAIGAIKSYSTTVSGLSASALAAADVDIISFEQVLRQLGVQLVTNGVEITNEHARRSFQAGTQYGSMALKRAGIDSVIGEVPADWRAIDALKVRNLSALRGITEETSKQIIREVTDGIYLGESIPKLATRINDRVNSIGIGRATTMARTEALHAFNQGAEVRYTQAGIEKLEWLTAYDDRVCPICGPLDGTVFDVKSRHERPPRHPMCRCTIIPVIEN